MKRHRLGYSVLVLSLLYSGSSGAQPAVSQMSPSAPGTSTPAASAAPAAARAKAPILSVPAGAGPLTPAQGTLDQVAAQLAKSPNTVVSEVNGTPITLGMVADRLRDMPENLAVLPTSVLYRGALDDLETQRAMAIKAKSLGLDKQAEIIRRIGEATDHELSRALMRHIVSEMVTEDAIRKQYAQTVAGKPGPEEVKFRVIATETEDQALALLERLRNGASFEALARASSKDPSSFNGGEIGYQRRDVLRPDIGAVAFALAPGQTTAYPVYSSGLWFIIQVEGRRQGSTPTLAEARPQLLGVLDGAASLEVFARVKAAATIKDFGPTGAGSRDSALPAKIH